MIVSRSIISRSTLFVAALCIASIAMADVDIETNTTVKETVCGEVPVIEQHVDAARIFEVPPAIDALPAMPVGERPVNTLSAFDAELEMSGEVQTIDVLPSMPVDVKPADVVSVPDNKVNVEAEPALPGDVKPTDVVSVPDNKVNTADEPVLAESVIVQQSLVIAAVAETPAVIDVEQKVDLVSTEKVSTVITIKQLVVAPVPEPAPAVVPVQQLADNVSATETVATVPVDVKLADVVLVPDNKVDAAVEPALPGDVKPADVALVPDNKVNADAEPALPAETQLTVTEPVLRDGSVITDNPETDSKVDDNSEMPTDLKNDASWIQWLQTPEGKKYGLGAIAVITVLGVTYVLYKNHVPQRIYGYVVKNPIKSAVTTACIMGIAALVAHQQGITLDVLKDKLCFPVQP